MNKGSRRRVEQETIAARWAVGRASVLLFVGLLLGPGVPARAQPAALRALESPRRAAEVAAVAAYLRETHPGASWQTGPLPLDGPAVRAAYPGRRFYVVRSRPPLPPGAMLPGLLEAHRRAMDAWRAHHYISARVAVDARGRMAPLVTEADFNVGLRPAHDVRGLRTNAAALLTLLEVGLEMGPVAIRPGEVELRRRPDGWSAAVRRASWLRAEVELDRAGRCARILPPPPPPMPP